MNIFDSTFVQLLGIFLSVLTIAVTTLVASMVALRGSMSTSIKIYQLLIISFVFWSITIVVSRLNIGSEVGLWSQRASCLGGLLIVYIFYLFALSFGYTVKSIGKYMGTSLVLLGLYSVFVSLHPSYLLSFDPNNIYYLHMNTTYLGVYIVNFLIVSCIAFATFFKKIYRADENLKKVLKPVAYTTIVAFVGGLSCNLLPHLWQVYSLMIFGPAFTLPFTLLVASIISNKDHR